MKASSFSDNPLAFIEYGAFDNLRERTKADYNPNSFWINQVRRFRGIYDAFGRPVVTQGAGRAGTRYAAFMDALERSVQEGDNLYSKDFGSKLRKSWYGLETKLCQVPDYIFKRFDDAYKKLQAGTLKVCVNATMLLSPFYYVIK